MRHSYSPPPPLPRPSLMLGGLGQVLMVLPSSDPQAYLEFPLLQFSFFQYSTYLFLKVFSCQISWNSNDRFSRNGRISKKSIFHSIALFRLTTHCAAFNWVLFGTKKKLRISGFFVLLPFLRYLCDKRVKPLKHC